MLLGEMQSGFFVARDAVPVPILPDDVAKDLVDCDARLLADAPRLEVVVVVEV